MSARLPAPCPSRWWLLLSLLLLGAAPGPRRGAAFYLPGLAPVNFCEEEKKTDECKVGAARRTTPPPHPALGGAGVRGEGGVAAVGRGLRSMSPLRSAGPWVGGGSGTASVSGGGRLWRTRWASARLGSGVARSSEQVCVCVCVCVYVCVSELTGDSELCARSVSAPRIRGCVRAKEGAPARSCRNSLISWLPKFSTFLEPWSVMRSCAF